MLPRIPRDELFECELILSANCSTPPLGVIAIMITSVTFYSTMIINDQEVIIIFSQLVDGILKDVWLKLSPRYV